MPTPLSQTVKMKEPEPAKVETVISRRRAEEKGEKPTSSLTEIVRRDVQIVDPDGLHIRPMNRLIDTSARLIQKYFAPDKKVKEIITGEFKKKTDFTLSIQINEEASKKNLGQDQTFDTEKFNIVKTSILMGAVTGTVITIEGPKQLVEELIKSELIPVTNDEGEEEAIFLKEYSTGQSLGAVVEHSIEKIFDRFDIQDEVFQEEFRKNLIQEVREMIQGEVLRETLLPELVILEDLTKLPETFSELEQLLGPNRYLIVIDPFRNDEEMESWLLGKYGREEMPRRLQAKGLKEKKVIQRTLAGLSASFEGIDFEDRVVFVLAEAGDLQDQVSRLNHRVMVTEKSPTELVLPLSYHIAETDGQIAPRYLDYVLKRGDRLIRILSLDEAVRKILIVKHAETLFAQAA